MSNGTAASPALASSNVAARPVSARTKWLLEAPILPTLLRLSFPNFLNLAAISGLITFDGLFLGWLGPIALAGVSLVFPFVMVVLHIANSGMGGAVSSAVARALGAGARDRADALATHAFVLAVGLAAVFSSMMLIIGPVLYQWMGGRGEMLDAALTYSTIAFGGVISICLFSILANVVRATGNMIFPRPYSWALFLATYCSRRY
jgi:Na+-driven multidrug efflux pump